MAIELTTFRARTRGKAPKEFTFQGVGKPETRKVQDADGNPIVLDSDGKQVAYKLEKKDGKYVYSGDERISSDEKGNLTLSAGLRYVEVDDVDVSGLLPNEAAENASDEEKQAARKALLDFIQDVIRNLYKGSARNAAIGMLQYFNETQRNDAAPKTAPAEDILAPIVAAIRAAVGDKEFDEKAEGTWRRSVTMGADAQAEGDKATDKEKIAFALNTKPGRKVKDVPEIKALLA